MTNNLDKLPLEITRNRVLNSTEAAEFYGFSVAHWRRLYRAGKVPAPIQLSDRKYGWKVGDLIEDLNAKQAGKAAA